MNRLLVLLFVSLVPIVASTASTQKIDIKYNYSRFGKNICNGMKSIQLGSKYLLCESQYGSLRSIVRLKGEMLGENQVKLSASIEEIDATGKVIEVSNPTIVALLGEEASVAQGDDNLGEALKLTFTAVKLP